MGHYTRLQAHVRLRYDTPDEVIQVLDRIVNDNQVLDSDDWLGYEKPEEVQSTPNHPFFQCPRADMLLLSNDFGSTKGGRFKKIDGYWQLDLDTQFKNYDGEIDLFEDWIKPYSSICEIQSTYIG